jgi:hypothetical protein
VCGCGQTQPPHHFALHARMCAAPPCNRFAASPGAPPCKENLLRFCQTDLAASVYNWRRFVSEGRAFSKLPSYGLGLNDGLLAEQLQEAGWKVSGVWGVWGAE